MQVGIIGPPQSGKSTLFHSLTGVCSGSFSKSGMTRGVAQVPDERVNFLAQAYGSKKAVMPSVEFVDSPPIESGGLKKAGFRTEFLRGLEQTDALLLTIPMFLPGQKEKAPQMLPEMETEFILADLEIVESRLEKVARDIKRGAGGELKRETELLRKCKEELEREIPLRNIGFSGEEIKSLRGFSFLTIKPVLTVLNIAESDLGFREEIEADFERVAGVEAIPICAAVQSEIAELPPEEKAEFIREMGVSESAGDKVIRRARDVLDLITFLTASETEAHAWDLKRGSTALKAAGVVHSDMERGFIRAEVFSFEDLKKHGSEAELRSKGLIRLEGKNYVVAEGDVIFFRFNV